jgi:Zn-dependent protease
MNFNSQEVKDIIITILALSTILSLRDLFSGGAWLSTLILSLFITTISLIVKLAAHKVAAEKYDCTAVYKFSYNLFVISLLLALLSGGGIIFAALGSIIVSSALYTRLGHKFVNITLRETGLVALSGPMANIVLSLVSLVLYPVNPTFFQQLLNLNVFMAVFNLVPLPPLDGSKVIWWNRLVWFICFLIAVFLFFMGRTALFTIIGIILLMIIIFVLWEKMF